MLVHVWNLPKLSLCHRHSSLSPETVKQQLDQTGSHQRQEESFNSSVSTAPARSKPKSEGTRSVPKSGSRASPDQARTVSLWMFPYISVSSSSSQPFPKRLHCEANSGSSHTPWALSITRIPSAHVLPGHGDPSLTGSCFPDLPLSFSKAPDFPVHLSAHVCKAASVSSSGTCH